MKNRTKHMAVEHCCLNPSNGFPHDPQNWKTVLFLPKTTFSCFYSSFVLFSPWQRHAKPYSEIAIGYLVWMGLGPWAHFPRVGSLRVFAMATQVCDDIIEDMMEPTAAAPAALSTSSQGSSVDKLQIMDLPLISMKDFGKDITCQMCGHSAWEDSPFNDACGGDIYGGKWPWPRYRRSPCGQFKNPRDRSCLVCHISFNNSSLRIRHGDAKQYMKYVEGKPEEHVKVKKSNAALIVKVNESDENCIETLKKMAKCDGPLETVAEDIGNIVVEACAHLSIIQQIFCNTCRSVGVSRSVSGVVV